jgi:hypothetical protein
MRARIYVSEVDVRKLRLGSTAALLMDGFTGARKANVVAIGAAASGPDEGPDSMGAYKGVGAAHYYVATIHVENPGAILKDGMTGTAKIFVQWRSVAGFIWRAMDDFIWRKLW